MLLDVLIWISSVLREITHKAQKGTQPWSLKEEKYLLRTQHNTDIEPYVIRSWAALHGAITTLSEEEKHKWCRTDCSKFKQLQPQIFAKYIAKNIIICSLICVVLVNVVIKHLLFSKKNKFNNMEITDHLLWVLLAWEASRYPDLLIYISPATLPVFPIKKCE